jgi:hypothetical protein
VVEVVMLLGRLAVALFLAIVSIGGALIAAHRDDKRRGVR